MNATTRRVVLAVVSVMLLMPTAVQAVGSDGPTSSAEFESLVAREGISIGDAEGRLQFRAQMGAPVEELEARYPDTFAGAEFRGRGEVVAVIHFVGSPPETVVKQWAGERRVLVAGGAAQSLLAAKATTEALAADFVTSGLQAVVGTDSRTGRTSARVATQGLMNVPSQAELDALPQSSRRTSVTITWTSKPLEILEASLYGGGHGDDCTFGYSGIRSGTRGLIGTGHGSCDTDDTYYWHSSSPGVGVSIVSATDYQGYWGDFAFYTPDSSSDVPTDDYYSSFGGRSDVGSVQTSLWYDDYVCLYGQTSGKECDYVEGMAACSGSVCNLSYTTNHISAGGDSGGPWYMGYDKSKALGIHRGYLSGGSSFSRLQYVGYAIGASVLTSP